MAVHADLQSRHVKVGNVTFGNDLPFVLIAGPCQMEGRVHALEMAEVLTKACEKLSIPLIYKSSFDKANRTSLSSSRGIGMDEALSVFEEIKSKFGCPVITDVHAAHQCEPVAQVVDVLQIPAFLCRQTDLLIAAAKTGRAINVKKGQFLAPWDMANVSQKIIESGNDKVMVCERGASFGYNTLVSDMRSLPIMAMGTGCPVVFDATHSVAQPGGQGATSGGQREFISVLARAAMSVGVAGLFMETHQDPDNAPCDGPNMIRVQELPELLSLLVEFDKLAKAHPVSIA